MAPVPQLTDAQILALVHSKVAELIGEKGEWTAVRRGADDTDTVFHSVLSQSVAVSITAAIVEARAQLQAGETAEPQHRAPTEPVPVIVAEAGPAEEEPAAMRWEPAPITVWTDLRKPVTGEIPAVQQRPAA
ncbi:hypothetical protein O159_17810 [Leifsonia xyli subsp. cynodontis DSM 46306]|uniref:Uncharacterized protein n=1 Tax=Leifsonia xyli subsp. cynodontis DSM 46306 TaxID=1389489 RepID=U3P8L6_LEIXC|nr:hypothetical protein O159_17810 [Leifsonia xyli subsp. cynodontis DSM 46306]